MTIFKITLFNRALGIHFERFNSGGYLLEIYLWHKVYTRRKLYDPAMKCHYLYTDSHEAYV